MLKFDGKQQRSVKQLSLNKKIKVTEQTLTQAQLKGQWSYLVSTEVLRPDTADSRLPETTRAHVALLTLCAAWRTCMS